MKVKIIILIILVFIIAPLQVAGSDLNYETEYIHNDRHLMFIVDTRQYYENNSMYLAQAPHRIFNGVTFISMRSFAERMGFDVRYRQSTKEYYMTDGEEELAYTFGESKFRHNGVEKPFRNGTSHVVNGSLMIPLRETAESLGIRVTPELSARKIHLNWTETSEIKVTYEPENETESFDVSVSAEKSEYKIGEDINYVLDIEGIEREDAVITWEGKEPVFFESGSYLVEVEVEGPQGTIELAEVLIQVSDDIYRTEEQYRWNNTNTGERVLMDGNGVLDYAVIDPVIETDESTLIRSNSPEKIISEGFYYEDTISGETRLLIHHQNDRTSPVQIYAFVKNRSENDVTIRQQKNGIGGPIPWVSASGRSAVMNYLQSSPDGQQEWTVPGNGQMRILTEISDKPMNYGDVLTTYQDLYIDGALDLELIVLESRNEFNRTYSFLNNIRASHDNRHTRGTFTGANRTMTVAGTSGVDPGRVITGNAQADPFLEGEDRITGNSVTNYGNRGMRYELLYENVEKNTAIIVNPRGGSYAGAFKVNGQVIPAPVSGTLSAHIEGLLLYKTGDEQEEVSIEFIPASGSNLPLNFLTVPLKTRE